MLRLCDWSKKRAQEEYNTACSDYFALSEKPDLLPKEKERKARLHIKMDLLQAVHFGNPFEKKLCKCCNNDFVAGYIGNGVVLEDICIGCYKRKDAESGAKRYNFKNQFTPK